MVVMEVEACGSLGVRSLLDGVVISPGDGECSPGGGCACVIRSSRVTSRYRSQCQLLGVAVTGARSRRRAGAGERGKRMHRRLQTLGTHC